MKTSGKSNRSSSILPSLAPRRCFCYKKAALIDETHTFNPLILLCQDSSAIMPKTAETTLSKTSVQAAIHCRPLLGAVSNRSPAYGATVTIPFTFTGGPAVPITRVVINRIGGLTHSLHIDQRQVYILTWLQPSLSPKKRDSCILALPCLARHSIL